MNILRVFDSISSSQARTTASLYMPVKATVILIRWPVVIICGYLLLYPSEASLPPILIQTFILLYIGSNVLFYFVNEQLFRSSRFCSTLVLLDTLVLTSSLIINGHAGMDFYLAYFLLIIISCIFESPRMQAIISVLAPTIYAALLFQSSQASDPTIYLRIPFLFVVALFYGYFTQLVRREKTLKEEAQRLAKQAEQRNREKIELFDIVCHEVRTPLTLISGFAQAMKNKIFGAINDNQEQVLSKILRQSDNLLNVTNSILDATKIESGLMAIEKEKFSVANFVEELRSHYDGTINTNLRLIWDCPPTIPLLKTDKAKLRVIVQNLVNNAIRFTDDGEIKILARYESKTQRLELKVADTGVGIPQKSIPLIFEKFRRVDGSEWRDWEGMGLGLYIAKFFTEMLGGTITVESEVGKGTTFTVTIPCEPEENYSTVKSLSLQQAAASTFPH